MKGLGPIVDSIRPDKKIDTLFDKG
jgi:hypothetical protein